MTKFRFRKGKDGTIIIRAERILGKQLVSSVTKVLAPDEDLSAAMYALYQEVRAPGKQRLAAAGTPSEPRVPG